MYEGGGGGRRARLLVEGDVSKEDEVEAMFQVLDVNCKVHDLDNVYRVDSSFFASSSSVNPTLTIIANALRVADHLRARLG